MRKPRSSNGAFAYYGGSLALVSECGEQLFPPAARNNNIFTCGQTYAVPSSADQLRYERQVDRMTMVAAKETTGRKQSIQVAETAGHQMPLSMHLMHMGVAAICFQPHKVWNR